MRLSFPPLLGPSKEYSSGSSFGGSSPLADRCGRGRHMLGSAIDLPWQWPSDGQRDGDDELASLRLDVRRVEALRGWLRARTEAGNPCAWLRPEVLVSINPGRPLAGLHGDRELTTRLHEAAVWRGRASRGASVGFRAGRGVALVRGRTRAARSRQAGRGGAASAGRVAICCRAVRGSESAAAQR